jgi:multiple sugar transport system ATP-binding protein
MARIALQQVRKQYPDGFTAVGDLSLDVDDGELLVLVGPSGSGKSTLLRMIAGLEPVSAGRIFIGDRDVTALPPQERDLAMVFQSYALYPHLTVRQNLAFGLTVRRRPAAVIRERVSAAAESLGLTSLLDRKPGQLSGGQRQRVALGRAIVREPLAFLFDEPLSNLDARLRVETRAELARLHQRLGATMVYVTHDQVEAMTLGTRVAVMHEGALQQVAPPMELYRTPATQFVAGFIGSPAMTFVPGVVRRQGDAWVFHGGGLTLALGERAVAEGQAVVLGIRPQALTIGVGDHPEGGWPGRVWLVEPLGSEQIVHVATGDVNDLVVVAPTDRTLQRGDDVRIRVPLEAVHLFHASTGRRIESHSSRLDAGHSAG